MLPCVSHHLPSPSPSSAPVPNTRPSRLCRPTSRKRWRWRWSASIGIGAEEIAQVVHNKVLLAAGLSTVAGQLSKPFTSAVRGYGFDLAGAVKSGGMPSTHSAIVVAAATSLGLQRGFSDSMFGMSVVFACIVMYDAQGVRREVGEHSKAFNSLLVIKERGDLQQDKIELEMLPTINSENPSLSLLEKTNVSSEEPTPSYASGKTSAKNLKPKPSRTSIANYAYDQCETCGTLMNESVGHTKLQVVVGAILGFLMSLAIEAIL